MIAGEFEGREREREEREERRQMAGREEQKDEGSFGILLSVNVHLLYLLFTTT